jgi:Leucine-rich repeat (LRR) protein
MQSARFPLLSSLTFSFCSILYGNSFTGTLPEELTNLNNLRELVLGKNSFWGPLPNGLSSMVNLEQLSLQDQQGRELIDGKLPDFSPATNLWYLDLSNNDLTGAIPVDFLAGRAQSDNRNASIMILLGDNDLTGSLPTGLKNFEDLFIDVAGNRIQSIPSVLCQKSKWMYGAVGDIGSCDAILCPAGFYSDSGRQDSLDEPCRVCPVGEAQFLGQTLCQVFESEREILQRLFDETGGSSWVKNQSWGTNDPLCSWQGVTCVGDLQDEEGVESIDLSFNGLVGTSPSDIWSLPQLLELSLRGNDQLVVHFVGMSKERTVIEILDLSNTRVESLEGLEDAVHVKELYLDETGLSGKFQTSDNHLNPTMAAHMLFCFQVLFHPKFSRYTSLSKDFT